MYQYTFTEKATIGVISGLRINPQAFLIHLCILDIQDIVYSILHNFSFESKDRKSSQGVPYPVRQGIEKM